MAARSFPPPIDVTSLNSLQQNQSVFLNTGSPLVRSSEHINEARASPRWRPTEKHKKLLEELFAAGLRNPTPEDVRDIVDLLELYGDVKKKNVYYWFQNRNTRKRRQEQKISMQESSQYEKEITELPPGPPCTPSTPGNNITSQSSLDQAQEDASSMEIEGAVIRMIVRQHFNNSKKRKQRKLTINQNSSSAKSDSSSTNAPAPAPAGNMIWQPSMNITTFSPHGVAISTEYERRGELLPLQPDGNVRSPTLKRKRGGEELTLRTADIKRQEGGRW